MRVIFGIFILMFLTAGVAMAAQDQPRPTEHHPGAAPVPGQSTDMMRCQQIMFQRVEAMGRMEAMDRKMDELLAEMNQSKGERKIEAMTRIIGEMAAQRKEMRQAMMQMNEATTAFAMCQMAPALAQGMMQNQQEMMRAMMPAMMQQLMRGIAPPEGNPGR